MATKRWRGNAVNIKQIATCVVTGTWAQNDTLTLAINGLDFVITIGTLVTTAQVATTIKQAFNGETLTDTAVLVTIAVADGGAQAIPPYSEMVATVSSSTVTFTARTADKPFTMTATANTAGNGDVTYTNAATSATGRRHANNADNWVDNSVPDDNDAVVFDEGSIDARYSLDLAKQPLTITKHKTYTGNVGLAETDIDNAAKPYREYRTPTYLTTDNNTVTTTADLEIGQGPGSGRFKWNAADGQAVVNIHGRGQRAVTGVPCILFVGTHASNEVNNIGGDLGIAFYVGEAATIPTLRTGGSQSSPAETVCGTGVTLTTVVTNANGKCWTDSAITTLTQNGGHHYHRAGTITTANILGGTYHHLEDATITTLTVGPDGTFDARDGTDSFVITNTVQLYKGSKFYDPKGRAGNVVFKLNQCGLEDVTIEIANNKTLTPS